MSPIHITNSTEKPVFDLIVNKETIENTNKMSDKYILVKVITELVNIFIFIK